MGQSTSATIRVQVWMSRVDVDELGQPRRINKAESKSSSRSSFLSFAFLVSRLFVYPGGTAGFMDVWMDVRTI